MGGDNIVTINLAFPESAVGWAGDASQWDAGVEAKKGKLAPFFAFVAL